MSERKENLLVKTSAGAAFMIYHFVRLEHQLTTNWAWYRVNAMCQGTTYDEHGCMKPCWRKLQQGRSFINRLCVRVEHQQTTEYQRTTGFAFEWNTNKLQNFSEVLAF